MELMPVQEFNENSVTRINPQTGQPLRNYWGYDPVAFFAPKASYSSSGGVGQQKLEFKEMVRAFHTGRHRSDSGRGVQSHGGGKRTGPDALFPRDG